MVENVILLPDIYMIFLLREILGTQKRCHFILYQ